MSEEVFTRTALVNGKVVCYRFLSTGSEAAEKWFQDVLTVFREWKSGDEPILMLIDLSAPDNFLSAEALKSARQASQINPNVPGKTAILIDGDEPSHNVKALVEHVLAGSRDRKIFTTEDDAIAWLLA